MADEMELDGCREGDSDLPEGWGSAPVSDLITINYGKGLTEANRRGGTVPVYGSAGIVGYHDESLTAAPALVIGRKGTVGAVSFSESSCWPIDTAYFVDEFCGLDPKYLYYALDSIGLGELDTSTAVPGLNREDAYRQQILLPPVAEQKRIVTKVEELLAQVNAVRGRLAKVPAIIKRFRQSVLAAACSGRLTADWRENHPDVEPASELLKCILAERRRKWESKTYREPVDPDVPESLEIPESWIIVSLDALATRVTSGSRDWKKYYGQGNGTFILSQNVRPGALDMAYQQLVNPPVDDRDRKRSEVRIGDLLITIAGNVGDVCWVPEHLTEHYVCQSVALMRPVDPALAPYLSLYLNSLKHGRGQFDRYSYGDGRPHLSFDQIKMTAAAIPPLPEQEEIVRRVEALFALADDIEKGLRAATLRTEKLTQAILAKAFRGELVPTEAELALKQGRTYEPASVLLDRIRQERAEQEASKPKHGIRKPRGGARQAATSTEEER